MFNLSAAMYELYWQRLGEHFYNLSKDEESNITIIFNDSINRYGATVETLMKVYQKAQSGYDRLKYSINMYHTSTRIMGNGRQSTQFNTEHSKITDSILASEQVSDLDEELYNDIVEGLRNISVSKRTSNLSVGILSNESMRRQERGNSTPNIVLLHNNEVASIPHSKLNVS